MNAFTEMLAMRAASGQNGEPGFSWIGWTPAAQQEPAKTLVEIINED